MTDFKACRDVLLVPMALCITAKIGRKMAKPGHSATCGRVRAMSALAPTQYPTVDTAGDTTEMKVREIYRAAPACAQDRYDGKLGFARSKVKM
jgi:hypothetical protein